MWSNHLDVYQQENADAESWESRWKVSSWKKADGNAGQFTLTAGKWFGDEKQDMGIQTGPDARFYNTYAALDKPFNNEGKDLVLQVRS